MQDHLLEESAKQSDYRQTFQQQHSESRWSRNERVKKGATEHGERACYSFINTGVCPESRCNFFPCCLEWRQAKGQEGGRGRGVEGRGAAQVR